MHFIRTKIRAGAQLALFALVFQLAVSFGHMHRDDLGLPPLVGAAAAQFGVDAAHKPANSTSPDNPAGPADYCPICASIYLAATSFVPSAPLLPLPPDFKRLDRQPSTVIGRVFAPPRNGFQPRAPPSA